MKFSKNHLTNIKFWKCISVIAIIFPLLFFIRAGSYSHDGWLFTLFDDAMISMTYARTLAETGELVWFPGAERVQGFTNLLWTLYMSFLHSLGLNGTKVSAAISLTSIFSLIGSSIICASLVSGAIQNVKEKKLWALYVATIIPLLYPLVFWSLRGMEVGLLCFLTLLTLMLALEYEDQENKTKHRILFAGILLISVIGVLIRLDFAPLILVILLTQFILSSKKKHMLLLTLTNISFVILASLSVLAFQFIYYGDFLPNTYRLKIEGYTIFERVLTGFLGIRNVAVLIFLVMVSGFISLKNKNKKINKITLIASGVFLTSCAYSVWVGGDAWEWSRMANRYISTTLPLAIISIMLGAYQFFYQSRLKIKYSNVKIFFLLIPILYLLIFIPGYSLKGKLFSSLLMTVVAVICYKLYKRYKKNLVYNFQHHLMLFFLLLTLVGGWSGGRWILYGGMHVKDDFNIYQQSIYLKKITTEKAVIATVMAGTPAYYSERSMIDLLGKSDREIASRKPIGKMHPGHNKWDYNYSVGLLRPDIIFQLWGTTDKEEKMFLEWGYVQKCLLNEHKAYFLNQSKGIRGSFLKDC